MHLLTRVVRWVNIAIAAVLLVVLAAVYWYGYRPLPKTSGRISARVTHETVIARDALGVPHIRAASIEDALFAQGYATAQDRLWQMDSLRRLAAGELSEVFGPGALEADRNARRLRMRRIAEHAVAAMPPEERALFAAYTAGVNDYIRTHLDRLPVEFTLLGYGPRLWSAADCALTALEMFRTLTTTWPTDVAKRSMLAGGDPAKVALLFPSRGGGDTQPGSNAWAVAGSRTASGKPLLASDPHLQYSIPGTWYMVHLEAPGLNVAGVALPGVPGVVVGHNERIAWGVTNLGFDVQDLYIEKINEQTGRYLYRGAEERASGEQEIIRVKGAPSEQLLLWVTRHGPLFASEGSDRMALRWAAAEPGGISFPLLDIDRARNWGEFTAALERFAGPAQNFVYADVDGNIGYHAAGRLPVRKGWNGDVPVDGASGNYEWDGWIPFKELPSAYNPPSGIIVSANQDPFPAAFPYTVEGNFAAPYRSGQIRDMLSAGKGWRAGEMLAVQKDVYSGLHRYIARSVVAAWDKDHSGFDGLAVAVDVLRPWNGQMEKDQAAPVIAALVYQHLRRAIAERAAPGKAERWDSAMAPAVIESLLRMRPAGWFPDWDRQLLVALRDGVEEGRRAQGSDPRRWWYGKTMRLAIQHPVMERLPLVGPRYNIGPVAMSGAPITVKQTTARVGPSMRMVADTGDWERSLLNVVTGQSGQPLSSHYKDQWPRYYVGESYPMQFGKVNAPDELRLVPE